MIQSINFMGREECLTRPAKQIIDKTHEYIGAGSYIENSAGKVIDNSKKIADERAAELNEAIRAKYAPFSIVDNAKKEAEQMGKEWAVAHGNPVG